MKNLFAIVLLVTAMAATGCGEKKPAAKPATPAPAATPAPTDKPAETPPPAK
jgi:hypothetical protein